MKSDGPSSPPRHATHQAKSSAAGNDSLSSPKRVTLSADSSSIPSPQRMSHVDFSEVMFDAAAPSKRATRMAEFSAAKSDGPSSPPKRATQSSAVRSDTNRSTTTEFAATKSDGWLGLDTQRSIDSYNRKKIWNHLLVLGLADLVMMAMTVTQV